MKKTLWTLLLAAGIGSVSAATVDPTWEFTSNTAKEHFTTGSGISLEGWTISSAVTSTTGYEAWASKPGNDRNISTQTVGMWLDLSSTNSAVTIYTFGNTGHLQGLQLVYDGNGTFTSKRTGENGQKFTVNQSVIDGGWFNLTMVLNTDTTNRQTDFQFFLNGEELVNLVNLPAGLNGGQDGAVAVGGDATTSNSFSMADFKAYDSVMTGDQIKEAWGMNMVPEPATASLGLLGLGALLMRRRRA